MLSETTFIERTKAEAMNLGFSLIGISTPSSLIKQGFFNKWLEQGFQGEMDYLSRADSIAKRISPSLLVPNCKTVISLGFFYPLISFQTFPNYMNRGWISSYAVFSEYHTLLINLAGLLILKIQAIIEQSRFFKAFTDSAPIFEREFGALAKLGWIGKNSNLISPNFGSTFLLTEILTDFEISVTQSIAPDRCGNCRRCIDACPTQCILPNRTLDARKCISYLTIEHKGNIPYLLRDKIGNWVFGCDICQIVCPWNHRKHDNQINSPQTIINPTVNLLNQLNFSEKEFFQTYSGTAVLRSGWIGFIRNLIITSGFIRDLDTIPRISQILLENPSSMLRSHAAWTLGRLQTRSSHNALCKALELEPDLDVIMELKLALDQWCSS
jgi:epoxyqueuosine reductase